MVKLKRTSIIFESYSLTLEGTVGNSIILFNDLSKLSEEYPDKIIKQEIKKNTFVFNIVDYTVLYNRNVRGGKENDEIEKFLKSAIANKLTDFLELKGKYISYSELVKHIEDSNRNGYVAYIRIETYQALKSGSKTCMKLVEFEGHDKATFYVFINKFEGCVQFVKNGDTYTKSNQTKTCRLNIDVSMEENTSIK